MLATEAEPIVKQGFLPGEKISPLNLPPASLLSGSPLSGTNSAEPGPLAPPRLVAGHHVSTLGWVFFAFNSSIAPLWSLAAQWFRPLRPFSPFLPLPSPLHTSLILAKPREGGGGGFQWGRRERQALQHPAAAIEWLSDGAYLSLFLSLSFFFPLLGIFRISLLQFNPKMRHG